jgi:hypothetical protein
MVGIVIDIADLRLRPRPHDEPPPGGIVGVADRPPRRRLARDPVETEIKL